MRRSRLWLGSAAAILGLASGAPASEPPSTKVDRWHEHICPRDLTPMVFGPFFGFHPTRWRAMPGESVAVPAVVVPTAAPAKDAPKGQVVPAGKKVGSLSRYSGSGK